MFYFLVFVSSFQTFLQEFNTKIWMSNPNCEFTHKFCGNLFYFFSETRLITTLISQLLSCNAAIVLELFKKKDIHFSCWLLTREPIRFLCTIAASVANKCWTSWNNFCMVADFLSTVTGIAVRLCTKNTKSAALQKGERLYGSPRITRSTSVFYVIKANYFKPYIGKNWFTQYSSTT